MKSELRSLFVSPVAWILLALFVIFSSMSYITMLNDVIRWRFAGYEPPLTSIIFAAQDRGVFEKAELALIFFVPLLTMGLISRDRQSGTIRLLMSSPVSVSQIVLGKYLAVVVYLLLFLAMITLLLGISASIIPNLDYARVLSGMLGMYLLACTYAAIGLFASSLTSYQTVAAISGIALLVILSFIGSIGQRVPMLSYVAYWMAIEGRVDYFRQGLIASKDVLYFLLVIAMFLAFSYLTLSSDRKRERIYVRAFQFAGASLAVAVLGYVGSLPETTYYLDTTQDKAMTLSKGSIDAVHQLEGPIQVTVYVNVLDRSAGAFAPAERHRLYRRLFDNYVREVGKIDVEYKYYYAESTNERLYIANPGKSNEELAREFAEQNRLNFNTFLTPLQVNAALGLGAENFRNVLIVEWGEKSTVLRTFDDIGYFPKESEISAALKRLVEGPAIVAYVKGQNERSAFRRKITDHFSVINNIAERDAIVNQGFSVIETTLDQPLLADIDILVLAAPTQRLSSVARMHLREYIDKGGNMLLLGEHGSQMAINEVVNEFGVTFADAQLDTAVVDLPDGFVLAQLTECAAPINFAIPPVRAHRSVLLVNPMQLSSSSNNDYLVKPILNTKDASRACRRGEPALGVTLEREVGGVVQRIAIISDADFMSTGTLSLPAAKRTNNEEIVLGLFRFLSGEEYPIDVSRPAPRDIHLSLDLRQLDYLKLGLYLVLPGLIVLLGGGLLIRRHRS